MTPAPSVTSGRAFERLVNFTDGVSAVAITLLALPLTSIGLPEGDETVWQLIARNSGMLIAYAVTFIVVAVMWSVHARLFQMMIGYDRTLMTLNIAWLMLLAFLPWPSSMWGEYGNVQFQGGEGLAGVGLLYWSTLAALSVLTTAMAWHAHRNPGLLHEGAQPPRMARGVVFASACLAIGLLSLVAPTLSMWAPLAFAAIGPILRRVG